MRGPEDLQQLAAAIIKQITGNPPIKVVPGPDGRLTIGLDLVIPRSQTGLKPYKIESIGSTPGSYTLHAYDFPNGQAWPGSDMKGKEINGSASGTVGEWVFGILLNDGNVWFELGGGGGSTVTFYDLSANLGAGNYQGFPWTSPGGTQLSSTPATLVEINGAAGITPPKWVIGWLADGTIWFDRDQGC